MPGSVSSKFNLCAFTLIILRLAIRALQDKLSIYCQILKHSSQEQSASFFQWVEVKVSKISRPCKGHAAVHRLFMRHVYLVYTVRYVSNQTNIPVAVNVLFTGSRPRFQMAWRVEYDIRTRKDKIFWWNLISRTGTINNTAVVLTAKTRNKLNRFTWHFGLRKRRKIHMARIHNGQWRSSEVY